jgi:dTMP kinase
MQQMAIGKTLPDVTFLLDVREDAGLQRAAKRGGAARFEKKDAEFHRNVRDGFLALAAENPKRIVVVDAENSFDAVWQQIEDVMQERFKL